MEFDDFQQENQNCNYAQDDYDHLDQGNDPEITSVEDLASGKPRDVAVDGVVIKAPLSCIFGSSLEVMSESNVDKV
ncbi:TPA: hypothetical protein ACH3X1_006162 [Trebouxia sp. C0004]